MKQSAYSLSQSQKMMVFVLSMSLFGLATLFSELVPGVQIGIVEFSIEYFAFIPLTLAILFDPFYAAIGAATGEVVFSEIMLGQFGGIGEVEKFILFSLGIYVAGMIVKDPLNRKQVAVASIIGIAVHQVLGGAVDILKVVFAIEEFEAISGLPQSVYFVEGWEVINDLLFSGILFCMLPTVYLVPRLYGKIEPLLGIRVRSTENRPAFGEMINTKTVLIAAGLFLLATTAEFLAESGINLIDWEADWAESSTAFIISIAIATVVIFLLVQFIRLRKKAQKVS